METLKEILNTIMNVYSHSMSNDEKHKLLSSLWTKYYKLSDEMGVKLDEAYNLYLIGENESYRIYQEPERKIVDNKKLVEALEHYNEVKNNNFKEGLKEEEIKVLLDYSVENARRAFEMLGINLKTNSLNGLCELGQALTIMPFEDLGFSVTKNSATICFNYPFNHVFGTVSFPYQDHGRVVDKTYLIDSTYRQFFSTIRCNEGRYYTEEENTNLRVAPDPGYFIEDIDFAKTLMRDGYIELNNENAKKYGEAFKKASISLDEIDKLSELDNIDYYTFIISSNEDYNVNYNELDGFSLTFPKDKERRL